MLSKIHHKITTLAPYDFFYWLTIINVLLIGAAIIFYNGRFLFWDYPFSSAGATYTVAGAKNLLSQRIYRSDMLISGLIMFSFAYNSVKNRSETQKLLKTLLSSVAGIGFVTAAFSPDDTAHNLHVFSSALIVSMIWLLATNYLVEVRKYLKGKTYYWFQLILQIPLFVYALTYFLQLDPTSYSIQKFALLGIGVVLLCSTSIYKTN